MRRKFLVIHNPRAGLKHASLLMRTLAELEKRGCALELAVAASLEEDVALAREAVAEGKVDAVVAAGGDSTVRGVAMGLAGTDTPLGIIPVGTGNVLAEEIGLTRKPEIVAATLMSGPEHALHMGFANGEPFLLMAGVGFDAEVVKRLDHGLKQRILKGAYALPTLQALAARRPLLEITVDGRGFEASFLVATRVRHYGGSMMLAPNASPERADIEIVLFQGRNRLALVRQLLMLAAGGIERAKGVVSISGREIRIEAPAGVPWQIDGECRGETPLVISPAPYGLRLIEPAGTADH